MNRHHSMSDNNCDAFFFKYHDGTTTGAIVILETK